MSSFHLGASIHQEGYVKVKFDVSEVKKRLRFDLTSASTAMQRAKAVPDAEI